MGYNAQEFHAAVLPEWIFPLIHDYAGTNMESGRMETLQALATGFLQIKETPTRLAINGVSDTLAAARDLGFSDPEINKFLYALDHLLRGH